MKLRIKTRKNEGILLSASVSQPTSSDALGLEMKYGKVSDLAIQYASIASNTYHTYIIHIIEK